MAKVRFSLVFLAGFVMLTAFATPRLLAILPAGGVGICRHGLLQRDGPDCG